MRSFDKSAREALSLSFFPRPLPPDTKSFSARHARPPLPSRDILWTPCTRLYIRKRLHRLARVVLSEIKPGARVKNARVSTSGKDLVYQDRNGRRDPVALPFSSRTFGCRARADYHRQRGFILPSFPPSSRRESRHFFSFPGRNQFSRAVLTESREENRIPLVSFRCYARVSSFPHLISIFNALVSRSSARDFIYHKVRRRLVVVVVLPLPPRYDSRIYRTYIESRQCFVCTLRALVLSSLVFALPFLMSLCHVTRTPFPANKHL